MSSVPVIRRFMEKPPSWTAGRLGGWLGTWSQTAIDAKFEALKSAHEDLGKKIRDAKTSSTDLSDSSSGTVGLAAAQKVFDEWDKKPIEWTDGDKALGAIKAASTAMDGVATSLSGQKAVEVDALRDEIGRNVANAFLETRTPATVRAIVGRVGADTLKALGRGGLAKAAIEELLDKLTTDALLKSLAPFGGKKLQTLFEDIPEYEAFAADSTFDEVSDVEGRLAEATISMLTVKYNAKTIKAKVLDPLGEKTVELIAAELNATQIAQLLDPSDGLGAVRVGKMVGNAGRSRVAELFARRVRLVSLSKLLKPPDTIVDYWNGLKLPMLEKLWVSKPDAEVAAVLGGVGVAALTSLLTSMDQAALFDHARRLSIPGLKGFGEAMGGADLVSVTKVPDPPPVPVPVPAVPGAPPVPVVAVPKPAPAPPGDALLKELGTTHAATLKAATKNFGNIATLNLVLRRCAQHLDAAKTAAFLADAVANTWHDPLALEQFFDLAGRNIEARVTLAKKFVTAGNEGDCVDSPGEGDPAKAAHKKEIDGLWWTVAEGDLLHYIAGHTYSNYAMSDTNAGRGSSTMWPESATKDKVSTDAAKVLKSAGFSTLVTGVTAGFVTGTIDGFYVGAVVKTVRTRVPPAKRGDAATFVESKAYRISQFYPSPGTALPKAEMQAVAKLFQSKKP